MKKFLLCALLSSSLALAENIVVGATPVPHAEILEAITPELKAQGYDLVIKEFNDYVLPNKALDEKDLDANFMQHEPYLREFNANNGTKINAVASVHLEPMGAYSTKIKNINELANGAKIAIPNDPTNESRALDVLASAGLIKLNENVKLRTPIDIIDNPKKLVFVELEGATLPRALSDVDLAVINSNFALNANLNPLNDALIIENAQNNPYSNILAVRAGDENTPKTTALKNAITSQKAKDFIKQKYQGAVIPSF